MLIADLLLKKELEIMDKEQVIEIYPHVLERKGKCSTVKSIECLYNKKLGWAALGYVSPCEFEAQYYIKQRQVAA